MDEAKFREAAQQLRLRHLAELRAKAPRDYGQRVTEYYQQVTPLLLETFGHSYQVALWKEDSPRSNLTFGERAGMEDGLRVLDMGCGCGGPALDWLRAFPRLSVDGITVASRQVSICQDLAQDEGLEGRWRVVEGDFHQLPYPEETFDLCLFMESSGHTDDLTALFSEAHRVLKPGGRIYCKEPYLHNSANSSELVKPLSDFEAIYTHRLVSLQEAHDGLVSAGFEEVQSRDISELVETESFWSQMRDSAGELTEFGRQHSFGQSPLPVIIGEVLGRKPDPANRSSRIV